MHKRSLRFIVWSQTDDTRSSNTSSSSFPTYRHGTPFDVILRRNFYFFALRKGTQNAVSFTLDIKHLSREPGVERSAHHYFERAHSSFMWTVWFCRLRRKSMRTEWGREFPLLLGKLDKEKCLECTLHTVPENVLIGIDDSSLWDCEKKINENRRVLCFRWWTHISHFGAALSQ